jgi:hypothetical protein
MRNFISDLIGAVCLFGSFYALLWILPAAQYVSQ